MPRQNRVNPFGELIATETPGTLMGNRGCQHDGRQRIRRPFAGTRWIICVLEFRGRHRAVMILGRYTELFFLDEATALAAGHRPCAECQRERYRLSCETWAAAYPGLVASLSPRADELGGVLHAERLNGQRGKRTYLAPLSDLPPGVLVADDEGLPYLVQDQTLMRWEPDGYGPGIPKPGGVRYPSLPNAARDPRRRSNC